MTKEDLRSLYASAVAEKFTPEQVQILLTSVVQSAFQDERVWSEEKKKYLTKRTVNSHIVMDVLKFASEIAPMRTPLQIEKFSSQDDIKSKSKPELLELIKAEYKRLGEFIGENTRSGTGMEPKRSAGKSKD